MKATFEVTVFGQTFRVALAPEWCDDEEAIEPIASDVVTGATSSVEFGFAPEPESYWGESDRHPHRRRGPRHV